MNTEGFESLTTYYLIVKLDTFKLEFSGLVWIFTELLKEFKNFIFLIKSISLIVKSF